MPLADFTSDLTTLLQEVPGATTQIVAIVKAIKPVLPTVKLVVDDPAFGRVIQQIQELHAIEASKGPAAPTPGFPSPAPSPATAGVGLSKAVPILDAVIYARRNPWAPWVFGGGLIALIAGVGYKLGQRKKS